MRNVLSRFAAAAVAALAAGSALPALAASSTSSAVSDSIGTSSGSISGSSEQSSDSSKTKKTARGDYDVVEVAAVTGQPGQMRLTLQSATEAGEAGRLFLTLPQTAAERGAVAAGQRVTATPRAYGTEFARTDTHEAFFLVLADDWRDQIEPRAVTM